jgi:hypothetical protein
MWPKVTEHSNGPRVDGAMTPVAKHLGVGATAQQVDVVDAVGPGDDRVEQGQHLAAGAVMAGRMASRSALLVGTHDVSATPFPQVRGPFS